MRSEDPEPNAVDAVPREAVKWLRRQEFFDAIDSGEIDLAYEARGSRPSRWTASPPRH